MTLRLDTPDEILAAFLDMRHTVADEADAINKGPYVGKAIVLLDDVLTRVQGHVHKKAPQLRALDLGSI